MSLIFYSVEEIMDLGNPATPENVQVKRRFALRILLKSVTYAFAMFGFLFIMMLIVLCGLLTNPTVPVVVPEDAVLSIHLDEIYPETRRDTLLTEMGGMRPVTFAELLLSLEAAADDERIAALAAKISDSSLGLAQIQELHRAVEKFRSSGKKAYLYSGGFGEFGGGTAEYYLATAFDKITMRPNSELGLTGISVEVPFFRPLLDKLGVRPEFYTRHEFKTAMSSFTDANASENFRNELSRLVGKLNKQMKDGIIRMRFAKEAVPDMQSLENQAPLPAEEAVRLKLIDEEAFETDWRADLAEKYSGGAVALADYAANVGLRDEKNKIAVLVLEGILSEGQSIENPISGEAVVGADTVLAQIEEIAANECIKAVVVRINSLGGSYGASDEIRHALVRLKEERNIPLIVSMGNYAASGGYFVALAGDEIWADPGTLTGSIGVLGGKFVLADLWNKIGVSWLAVDSGETAGVMSANRSFNARQKELFNRSLDRVYADFVQKTAQARGKSADELDKLARGRVWLGAEAVAHDLADYVGGLSEAVDAARQKAFGSDEEKVSLLFYPKPRTWQEKVGDLMSHMQVSASSQLKTELGLEILPVDMLKRLQYDAVLRPFIIK